MSNATMAPVPVTAHTCRPSVTGDGEESFCFWRNWFPLSSVRSQRIFPSAFAMQSRSRSGPPGSRSAFVSPSPSARSDLDGEATNTRSPQITGLPPLQEGSGVFQTMFSVSLQVNGNPVASLTLFCVGPRHCGQCSSPCAAAPARHQISANTMPGMICRRVCKIAPILTAPGAVYSAADDSAMA